MNRLFRTTPGGGSCDYVPDLVDLRSIGDAGRGDGIDLAEGVDGVIEYLDERIAAVIERNPGRPSLLLSGGVDSMLLAAALARTGVDCLAVTFSADVPGRIDDEAHRAAEISGLFGFEHEMVALDPTELSAAAARLVPVLGVSDPWEVLAATVLTQCDARARERGADGPIFTGAGADSLFLGGSEFGRSEDADAERDAEWAAAVRARVAKNFTRDRLIPDFYERLLERPERHIQIWQTTAAVELALSLPPTAVRGPEMDTDKLVLREAAVRRGVPRELVRHAKSPMQVSSGGVDGLVVAARRWLMTRKGGGEYADPMLEPLEYTVARLWLERSLGSGDAG